MTTPQSGREAFEAWISAPPFEQSVSRLNASSAWPGSYRDIATDLAWQAWQEALAQQGWEVGEAWKVRVFPVAVNGEDDAHRVEMKRGVQSFSVGPDYWNTREDAEAYAGQLRIALAAPKQRGREVGEAVAWIHKDGRALLLDESMHRATNPADWNPLYTAAPKQQAMEVTEEMVDRALAAYNASRGTYSGEVPTDRDDIRASLLAAPKQQAVDGWDDGVRKAAHALIDLIVSFDDRNLLALDNDKHPPSSLSVLAADLREALAALPGKTEVE